MKTELYKSAMDKHNPSDELKNATLERIKSVSLQKSYFTAMKYAVGAVGLIAACAAMVFGATMLNNVMSGLNVQTQTEESLVITLSDSVKNDISDEENTLTEGKIFADENGISIVPRDYKKLTTTDGKMVLNEKTTIEDCIAAGIPVYLDDSESRLGFYNPLYYKQLNGCINFERVYNFFDELKSRDFADIVICFPNESSGYTEYVYISCDNSFISNQYIPDNVFVSVYTYSDTGCLSIANYKNTSFLRILTYDYYLTTLPSYSYIDNYSFAEIKSSLRRILTSGADAETTRVNVIGDYIAPLKLDGEYYKSYIMGYFIERCKQEEYATCQAYEFDLEAISAAAYVIEYRNGSFFISRYDSSDKFTATECSGYTIDGDKISFTGNNGELYEFGYEYCNEEAFAQSAYDKGRAYQSTDKY